MRRSYYRGKRLAPLEDDYLVEALALVVGLCVCGGLLARLGRRQIGAQERLRALGSQLAAAEHLAEEASAGAHLLRVQGERLRHRLERALLVSAVQAQTAREREVEAEQVLRERGEAECARRGDVRVRADAVEVVLADVR